MMVATRALQRPRRRSSGPSLTRAVRDAALIEQFIESSTDDAICSLDPTGW